MKLNVFLASPRTSWITRHLRYALTYLTIAAPLLAPAGTITTVTRQEQRFFPVSSINVLGVDTATNELKVKSLSRGKDAAGKTVFYDAGNLADALLIATGGTASTPALTRLYTGSGIINDDSADPALLYALRFTSKTTCKLYLDFADAANDVNAIDFATAGSDVFEIVTATSNWCWDACSNMVLGNYGAATTQDAIADFALVPKLSSLGSGRHFNKPNHLSSETFPSVDGLKERRGVGRVLKELGDVSTQLYATLTSEEIQNEIDGDRPLIFQIGWYPGGSGTERRGGHVFVVYGLTGDNLTIADPWPSNDVAIISLSGLRSAGYRTTGIWEATLASAKALDLVFVIDSTGSMSDDIDQVKTDAAAIINNIAAKFKNYRLAVIDYKDSGDAYVSRVDVPFTSNPATAISGINGLSASGGGDFPEAVFSAVHSALDGTAIGGWRSGPTVRQILVIGDAPGHDPETFSGGFSSTEVIAEAQNPALPIRISGIIVGGADDALAMSDLLAGGTGGITVDAGSALDVPASINLAIDELAEKTRYPRGPVAALKPLFTLTEGDPSGMENPPTSFNLQLERKRGTRWSAYKRLKLDGDATTAQFPTELPQGDFRWRLALSFGRQLVLSPTGTVLSFIKAHNTVEADYAEFKRLEVLPQDPTIISPSPFGFVATNTTETYQWNAGINASSYSVEIFKDDRRWKRLTVKPPKNDPNAATLSVAVKGHRVGTTYKWRIQSLNYDRKKVDASQWVP